MYKYILVAFVLLAGCSEFTTAEYCDDPPVGKANKGSDTIGRWYYQIRYREYLEQMGNVNPDEWHGGWDEIPNYENGLAVSPYSKMMNALEFIDDYREGPLGWFRDYVISDRTDTIFTCEQKSGWWAINERRGPNRRRIIYFPVWTFKDKVERAGNIIHEMRHSDGMRHEGCCQDKRFYDGGAYAFNTLHAAAVCFAPDGTVTDEERSAGCGSAGWNLRVKFYLDHGITRDDLSDIHTAWTGDPMSYLQMKAEQHEPSNPLPALVPKHIVEQDCDGHEHEHTH